jgi:two-component system chemotaxis response regulator CheB
MPGRFIVVIGASAGGVEALSELIGALPPDLPASIFVVIHSSPNGPGILPDILNRAGSLPVKYAADNERIVRRCVYVAPPDHHLLLQSGRVRVTRGPQENGFRPAVDPLFRSAARAYDSRVVGVILSGALDDGTDGLALIKAAGGVAVVQNPEEAFMPSMPMAAIQNVEVDHIVALSQMAATITRAVREPAGRQRTVRLNPKSSLPAAAELGNLVNERFDGPTSGFSCPACGGALWEQSAGARLRYRCYLGHAYTADALGNGQAEEVESALWTALRVLEEQVALHRRTGERARKQRLQGLIHISESREKNALQKARVIREILLNGSEPFERAEPPARRSEVRSRKRTPGTTRSRRRKRTS